jgi:hypothetical protein
MRIAIFTAHNVEAIRLVKSHNFRPGLGSFQDDFMELALFGSNL